MTYAKLPGLTWDGTVYENEEMGTLEALLPTGGWPTAHAPAMVELPNGDLLCCWFSGTYEGRLRIRASRRASSPVLSEALTRSGRCPKSASASASDIPVNKSALLRTTTIGI